MKQKRLRYKLLFFFMFGLFAVLAVYGSYSVLTYGNRWFSSFNRNTRLQSQRDEVIAGDILDRNGVVLATTDEDGSRVYQSDEAARSAVVHVVGDINGYVSNGVESFEASYLYGFQASPIELIQALISGEKRRGDDVQLTIDSVLCTSIAEWFTEYSKTGAVSGAAVVLNWKTGEMLASVSVPGFDPMNVRLDSESESCWNRVTQSLYEPGSTFKLVTASSALENLNGVEDETFTCDGSLPLDGYTVSEFGGVSHGTLTLSQALQRSCNTVFAGLALRLGNDRLRKTAERYGFNDNFLFRDLVVANSVFPKTTTEATLAMAGFGQGEVQATPLHMCMVAAAIANDGVMMEPRLLLSVTSSQGMVRTGYESAVYRDDVISAETAAWLKTAMRAVVTGGTGTRAGVSGMTICGKTGTAESTEEGQEVNYGWFVGFCGDEDLPFAVCVLVENIPDGESGGTTAAPIAGEIFSYLQNHAAAVTGTVVTSRQEQLTGMWNNAVESFQALMQNLSAQTTAVPTATEIATATPTVVATASPTPAPTTLMDIVTDAVGLDGNPMTDTVQNIVTDLIQQVTSK